MSLFFKSIVGGLVMPWIAGGQMLSPPIVSITKAGSHIFPGNARSCRVETAMFVPFLSLVLLPKNVPKHHFCCLSQTLWRDALKFVGSAR
jgi:hypothetical protein